MKHRFKTICQDKSKLLDNCYSLKNFMNRLNQMAIDQEDNGYSWSSDDFKGLGFEALIEVMINLIGFHPRIKMGIKNYTPQSKKDWGIDGYGETNEIQSRRVTVQIKYRSDVKSYLNTEDNLSNFVANTTTSKDYKDLDAMFIFTTAIGVNDDILKKMYHGKVDVVGFKDLQDMIDNNPVFWDKFRSEMNETRI